MMTCVMGQTLLVLTNTLHCFGSVVFCYRRQLLSECVCVCVIPGPDRESLRLAGELLETERELEEVSCVQKQLLLRLSC